MNKQVLLNYLKEKNNEEEVISLLKEQKKVLANPKNASLTLKNDYFSLIIKLLRKSKGKIKYNAIILISNIGFCMDAKNFHEMCKIAAESSSDKDGDIRHACFHLIKNLNSLIKILPIINTIKKTSEAEVNLFYEYFRNLFYRLYSLFFKLDDNIIRKSILRSLGIMLPKIYGMAEFWNDREEMSMVSRIKDEMSKML
ncbi:MAG: hypothetical protein AABX33_05880 [Nanoarchaeota archaeon]